ncbi:hypothetical protein ADUPG1_008879, partial [Aduncisulcus paluster]
MLHCIQHKSLVQSDKDIVRFRRNHAHCLKAYKSAVKINHLERTPINRWIVAIDGIPCNISFESVKRTALEEYHRICDSELVESDLVSIRTSYPSLRMIPNTQYQDHSSRDTVSADNNEFIHLFQPQVEMEAPLDSYGTPGLVLSHFFLGVVKPWPELVDSVILTVISDLSKIKDFKNKQARKEAFEKVDAVFASTSVINLFDRLRKVAMDKKLNIDSLLAYTENTRLHALKLENAALDEDESSSGENTASTETHCQYCGKKGHAAKECRFIGGKRRYSSSSAHTPQSFPLDNAFENLLSEASDIVCECDSSKDDFGAVTSDLMRKYNLEWLQLLKGRPMTGWGSYEKVSRDLDDLRHYGKKEGSAEDPKAVILEEDSVKAKFHKTLGKSIVGVRKTSVEVHKHRSSENLSGSDELDLDFSATRGRGGRVSSRREIRTPIEERWRVYVETLEDRDMRDERAELEEFRCDIRREEELARSRGHRPDDYLVKTEPRERAPRGRQRSRRESTLSRESASSQDRPANWQPLKRVQCYRCSGYGHFAKHCDGEPLPSEPEETKGEIVSGGSGRRESERERVWMVMDSPKRTPIKKAAALPSSHLGRSEVTTLDTQNPDIVSSPSKIDLMLAKQQQQIETLNAGMNRLIDMFKSMVDQNHHLKEEQRRIRLDILSESHESEKLDKTEEDEKFPELTQARRHPLTKDELEPSLFHPVAVPPKSSVSCVHMPVALDPPVLKEINVAKYQKFLSDFKAYVARGGSKPIEHCLSSTVCRLLKFYASEADKKKPLMSLLRERLAPSSDDEFFKRLKEVKFKWTGTIDCIHHFNAKFLEVYDSSPATVSSRPTTVAKIYARAVTVKKLKAPLFDLIDDGVTELSLLGGNLIDTATRLLADGWRLRDDSQEKRFQSTE